ncbi:MAG: bacillithiol biosynthesis cysteine-adding enzyme BshC [Bacteroidota bacterium]
MSVPVFSARKIPLVETPIVGQLVREYLCREDYTIFLSEFQPSVQGLRDSVMKRKVFLHDRETLFQVISNQYHELERAGESITNTETEAIRDLSKENTFTVTTGHQLQLAGGPLFLAYKILSAVATARFLNSTDPTIRIVPIFWLATEDHDMAEIDHLNFKGLNLKWNNNWRGATGHAPCEGIGNLIDEMASALQTEPFGEEFIRLLRDCYKSEYSLSFATRIFIHRLFGRFGVVMIDADDHLLKSRFADCMKSELIHQIVRENVSKSLERFPVKTEPQVSPRDINLFYLTDKSRNRITRDNECWKVVDTDFSFDHKGILKELEKHPERFSPNVLLRPLYQAFVLPDIAYIGGPGELAYWLELSDLFKHCGIPMPVVLPRNAFLHLDNPTIGKMVKAGLDESDLFKSADDLLKRHTESKLGSADPFPALVEKLMLEYSKLESALIESDKSLVGSVKGELQKALKGLQQLREKWIRAEKRKEDTLKSQLERIHEAVFPNGIFQERSVSLAEFYVKYGPNILDVWLDQCAPVNDSLTILSELTA